MEPAQPREQEHVMDSRIQLMIVADHLQRDLAAAQTARRTATAAPAGRPRFAQPSRHAKWIHRLHGVPASPSGPSGAS
jgi:hypothetical protein